MRLLLVAAVLGCAPHARTVPRSATTSSPAREIANAPACIVADSSAPTRDTLYVVGVEARGADVAPTDCERRVTEAPPVIITESPTPGSDLRDVLDRGPATARAPRPDVVVTRDPNVLAYAARSAEYFTVALPYNRTYLLVSVDSAFAVPSPAERGALARDAVTADARGAAEPFAWLADASCIAPFILPLAPPRSIVAYPAGDEIARQLAERIVALAAARTRPAWLPANLASGAPRILAVTADSIDAELATGRAAAAIVALPRDPRARCGTSRASVPWRGVPLVDSRAHVIVRRGSGAAFIIGADGTLRFTRRIAP